MALTDNSVSIDNPVLATEPGLAIVLGTEGDGLPPETIAEADYVVRIPMSHGVDSLNVATATAVAFWQLRAGCRSLLYPHQFLDRRIYVCKAGLQEFSGTDILPLCQKRGSFAKHQPEKEFGQTNSPADSVSFCKHMSQLFLSDALGRNQVDRIPQLSLPYDELKRAAQIIRTDPRETLPAATDHRSRLRKMLQTKHLLQSSAIF